jgi:uncharacterized membrane protein
MKLDKNLALKIILVISIIGILFSGYLSYMEIFTGQSSCSAVAGQACGIFNIPTCVFGLAMYLIIFGVTLCGLKSKN